LRGKGRRAPKGTCLPSGKGAHRNTNVKRNAEGERLREEGKKTFRRENTDLNQIAGTGGVGQSGRGKSAENRSLPSGVKKKENPCHGAKLFEEKKGRGRAFLVPGKTALPVEYIPSQRVLKFLSAREGGFIATLTKSSVVPRVEKKSKPKEEEEEDSKSEKWGTPER